MASNDMNSWDDSDELLRQRWQQAFANFQVQPRSSLSRRILDPLMARHRRRQNRWLSVVGLLLLFSVGLLYQVRLKKYLSSGNGNSVNVAHPTPAGSVAATAVHRLILSKGRSISLKRPVIPSQALKKLPVGERQTAENQLIIDPLIRSLSKTPLQNRPERVAKSLSKSARSVDAGSLSKSSDLAVTVRHKQTLETTGQSVQHDYNPSVVPQLVTGQLVSNTLPIDWTQLRPHSILPLLSSVGALPGQIQAFNPKLSYPEKSIITRQRLHWFVDAIPLSSFQWMSAPPTSTAYLSQVHAPAAFSPATWGYQFNGGLQWQRWQAYLSIGQLRRWAYYTVNENRYRVEPSPANPDQLVRETHTVTEDVLLPMIGAGLSRQTLLAQGRYAVELGGQLSYLPTSDQALIGLRGGMDRRLMMSKVLNLQVGLTVEYGLNRLLSEQKQLAIHPLVLGFRFRLQPRLGDQNHPH